ncbi:hypothetical protein LCGC14_1197120 [marine sediment metagenome]|uniref:Uncharacterized protein n=1 Tax=marine sediment metagenome TaxID=412755 RepID=A0A0F9P0E3_9ZZZZ
MTKFSAENYRMDLRLHISQYIRDMTLHTQVLCREMRVFEERISR